MNEVVLGIDVGTQGARVLAVTPEGQVAGTAQAAFLAVEQSLPSGWFEQDPRSWWSAVADCLQRVVDQLPSGTQVAGISVDSTSGTVLPVDNAGEPLCPALMYNDQRSEGLARRVQAAAKAHQERFGFVFGSSYALPKILWIKEERPELYAQTHRFLHAADFIAGRLTGSYEFSDTSNALKTGYDLLDLAWPDFIERELGMPLGRLPQVVLPGEQIGRVWCGAAEETGLVEGTPVLAGATDGVAAQLASGAAAPGDWNSTLGTTLVLKGVSRELKPDPLGRVYSHRHPQGWWMPGGASNTGSDWIQHDFPGADLDDLNQRAAAIVPSGSVRYPLLKRGERFPFVHPEARGFMLGESSDPLVTYAAGLEGVALLERLAYEMLASIGLEVGERIYITGGGAKSLLWSQVRASVLGKVLVEPQVAETAFGAAVIAASGCWYAGVGQAAGAMVKVARTIEPDPQWSGAYAEQYARFIAELTHRGYLKAGR